MSIRTASSVVRHAGIVGLGRVGDGTVVYTPGQMQSYANSIRHRDDALVSAVKSCKGAPDALVHAYTSWRSDVWLPFFADMGYWDRLWGGTQSELERLDAQLEGFEIELARYGCRSGVPRPAALEKFGFPAWGWAVLGVAGLFAVGQIARGAGKIF